MTYGKCLILSLAFSAIKIVLVMMETDDENSSGGSCLKVVDLNFKLVRSLLPLRLPLDGRHNKPIFFLPTFPLFFAPIFFFVPFSFFPLFLPFPLFFFPSYLLPSSPPEKLSKWTWNHPPGGIGGIRINELYIPLYFCPIL